MELCEEVVVGYRNKPAIKFKSGVACYMDISVRPYQWFGSNGATFKDAVIIESNEADYQFSRLIALYYITFISK